MKFEYKKLAKVCLSADGGYCGSCAKDVAQGFKVQFKELDLDKLIEEIDFEMKRHRAKSDAKFKEWKKKNPTPKYKKGDVVVLPIHYDSKIVDISRKINLLAKVFK